MAGEVHARPVCTIIGGPNGSGKSTLYDELPLPGRFVNADNIARILDPVRPQTRAIAAGKLAIAELSGLLEVGDSFVFETTLSSRHSLSLMRSARDGGYEVGLIYVMLDSADLNVERVANRVSRGGHLIPEEVVRRRYESALRHLPDAIRLADGTAFYDNSASDGAELLALVTGGNIELNRLDEAHVFHCRLAEALSDALDISVTDVFRAAKPG